MTHTSREYKTNYNISELSLSLSLSAALKFHIQLHKVKTLYSTKFKCLQGIHACCKAS